MISKTISKVFQKRQEKELKKRLKLFVQRVGKYYNMVFLKSNANFQNLKKLESVNHQFDWSV